MNQETMSVFSPQLVARFDALAAKYPQRRSALVPMLLYAQDEVGYLSDAVISEVAERIGRLPHSCSYDWKSPRGQARHSRRRYDGAIRRNGDLS